MWRDSLASAAGTPDVNGTHYAAPVRDALALARYLAKDVKGGGALVPASFSGHVYLYFPQRVPMFRSPVQGGLMDEMLF